MQAFQVLQYLLILIISLTTFIEAQDKDYYNKPGCNSSCGDLWISYPFGIGRNCSANEWYTIDCNTYTPYLPALNNVEVFAIDTSTQRVTVKTSEFKADCKNPVINSKLVLGANHHKSPFRVSGSRNSFVVDGCGYGSLMEENGTIVTGCSTTCSREHIGGDQQYSCLGVDGCCQTALPHDLESFTLNRTGLLERPDGNRTCGSAFLVDTLYLDFPSQIIQGGLNFVPISLSWNERFDINVTRCNETCGGVSLAYPFGIEKNCSMSDWFHVDCKSSTPYLSAFDNMEVLDFDEEKETVTVNVSMNSDCDNPVQDSSLVLSNTPFRFSKSDNMFVVEGCGSASVMVNGNIVSGCSTTCGNYTVSDTNNCFGVGCCQTTIPRDLGLFTLDLTGLAKDAGNGKCASAFLVDKNSFMEGRFSRQFVPMTFKWHEIREPYAKACYLCESEGGRCSIYADDEGSSMMCIPLESNKKPIGVILGVSISMGLVFLTVISYALFKLIKKTKAKRRKQRCFKRNGGLLLKQQQATHTGLVDKTILFTSDELEKATDHFSESRILGRGGQGTVYKGMLADGRIVAIKKSKVVDENQLEQFINEVVILSQVNHRNVVKLLGCCLETEVPLLVSEFISNGTLYDLIQDTTGEFSFTLNKRLQIATEIAGALSYLHSATSIPIYHRDIKTTNILLDEKYRAKVSDFGTSRFVSIDQTHLTTLVKGTFGYLDPEYFQSSQFTEKSDVYSFGVVLLELLTREKPISSTRFGESINLVAHFMLAMEEDRLMSIFDAMVVEGGSMTELLAVANLAMRCLNFNGKNRPTMKEVSIELEGIRSSQVASIVQTNIGFVKHYEDLPLTYSMSTSTSMSYDYNPRG